MPLALLLALAGCGQGDAPEPAGDATPDIYFPQYRAGGQGGQTAFMAARMNGILALRGRCLGLEMAGVPGGFVTIVWPADARLGEDEEGPLVAIGPFVFRIGDYLTGGGGGMPLDFAAGNLQAPFPSGCRRHGAIELRSIDYGDPRDHPRFPQT